MADLERAAGRERGDRAPSPSVLLGAADCFSVDAAARDAPGRVAVHATARRFTFAELAAEVDRRHARLRRVGHQDGERVMIAPATGLDDVLWLVTLLDRGVPTVLAHPRWTAPERETAARVGQASLAIDVTGPRRIALTPVTAANPDEIVFFTSGSTGTPRAIIQSRSNLAAAAAAHAEALPAREDDAWELALPLAHMGGFSVITRALFLRIAVVLDGAAPATLSSLVPTLLAERVTRGDPGALRAVLVGGAALRPELLARARAAGFPCLPTYGMTETCGQIATQRIDDPRPEGVGPPLPGWTIALMDDGAIRARGPSLLSARIDSDGARTPAVDANGYFHTGDRGHLDGSGHLIVEGRVDDTIITGGENVDPREVEDALSLHPGVRDAVVVGVEDDRWGQVVAALVVSDASRDELTKHLRARLAGFKIPKRIVYTERAPLLFQGKVDRRAARALIMSSDRASE